MQKVTVWSAGNEKAITGKINLTCYSIIFILLCSVHILSFICNPYDDKTANVKLIDHIAFGGLILFILGWITLLVLYMIKDSLIYIKQNKLINLYLYNIDEFARIGNIPDDKFILFSDKYGVVLAEKEYENESRNFSFGAKYFYEFTYYCNKHNVK